MMSTSSSSDSPRSPPTKYDVFLSFRGEDTRDNFVSHLYDALCRKKIQTFIDYRLPKGEEISPCLLKNIEESNISVIIFSSNYASSKWCLDELVQILECKEKYGRIAIPIFYNIDPSNIRNQNGAYADAFVKHKQQFKNDPERVRRWKAALTDAANLSGWDSRKRYTFFAFYTLILFMIMRFISLI